MSIKQLNCKNFNYFMFILIFVTPAAGALHDVVPNRGNFSSGFPRSFNQYYVRVRERLLNKSQKRLRFVKIQYKSI